jgi:3-hydroxy-9,10-secoandrosta-1,3,5(10)-triene-9,17-dione monooxygenase
MASNLAASPAERPVFARNSKPAVLDSYEAAIDRARELAPTFRGRVAETERLRRLPDESAAELIESGLAHLMTPRLFGGSELGLDAVLDVTGIIAEACPSTGWVHALLASHMWVMAQYPQEVQEEVWSNPRSLIASVTQTKGTPTRVEGGYRWTGSGAYASGIDQCNWVSPALWVPGKNGEPERMWLLIPRSAFTIVDDWHAMGLKGTGTNTIVVDDVFIPENCAVSHKDMQAGTSPGTLLHSNPQYAADFMCIASPPLAGTALGAARGFFRVFEQRLQSKLAGATAQQAHDQAGTMMRWAKSNADVDAARALLLENAKRFSRTPSSQVSELDKAKCRRDQAYSAAISREAVNSLFESSGASALSEGSEVQRLWRDTNAAAAHLGLVWDTWGLSWARVSFGLPSINPGAP